MRGLVFGLLMVACWPVIARAQPLVRGTLPNGQIHSGELKSGPSGLHFVVREQKIAVPLALMKRVVFNSPTAVPATLPLRRIVLTTGESLHVALDPFDKPSVGLRFRNGVAAALPQAAIAQVVQRQGERQRVFEDFRISRQGWTTALEGRGKSAALVLAAGFTEAWPLETPLTQGVLSCWFRDPQTADGEWGVELQLSPDANGPKLRINLGGAGESYQLDARSAQRFSQQRLKKTNAEHWLLVTWSDRGTQIAVDNRLLAIGPPLPSAVHVIRFSRASAPESSPETAPIYLDDLHVAETGVAPSRLATLSAEGVQLPSGNELLGKIQELDGRHAAWETPFGKRELPWTEIHRVCFVPTQLAGRPTTGVMSRLEFTPMAGEPMAADILRAAVVQCDAHHVTAEHPYFGRLQIPTAELHSLQPEFSGTTWLLDPEPRHLGDEVRNDFRRPLAEGFSWRATFKLDSLPARPIAFRVEAVDLEPNGSKSPESPFRQELRQKFLLTELFVNGQQVDDLNRFVNARATAEFPVRIQVPLPSRWLKLGDNEVKLVQKSRQSEPGDFDDAEFSMMAIEMPAD